MAYRVPYVKVALSTCCVHGTISKIDPIRLWRIGYQVIVHTVPYVNVTLSTCSVHGTISKNYPIRV